MPFHTCSYKCIKTIISHWILFQCCKWLCTVIKQILSHYRLPRVRTRPDLSCVYPVPRSWVENACIAQYCNKLVVLKLVLYCLLRLQTSGVKVIMCGNWDCTDSNMSQHRLQCLDSIQHTPMPWPDSPQNPIATLSNATQIPLPWLLQRRLQWLSLIQYWLQRL